MQQETKERSSGLDAESSSVKSFEKQEEVHSTKFSFDYPSCLATFQFVSLVSPKTCWPWLYTDRKILADKWDKLLNGLNNSEYFREHKLEAKLGQLRTLLNDAFNKYDELLTSKGTKRVLCKRFKQPTVGEVVCIDDFDAELTRLVGMIKVTTSLLLKGKENLHPVAVHTESKKRKLSDVSGTVLTAGTACDGGCGGSEDVLQLMPTKECDSGKLPNLSRIDTHAPSVLPVARSVVSPTKGKEISHTAKLVDDKIAVTTSTEGTMDSSAGDQLLRVTGLKPGDSALDSLLSTGLNVSDLRTLFSQLHQPTLGAFREELKVYGDVSPKAALKVFRYFMDEGSSA